MPEDKLTPRHETDHHGHDGQGHHGDGKLYETQDVNLSAIVKSLFVLVAFLVFSAVAAAIMLFLLVPNVAKKDALTQEEARVRQQLPGPRLQANPVQEIHDYRMVENAQLHSYGRDPRTGALHIPIDIAIEKVVTDLPTRAGATEVDIKTTTAPNTPIDMQGQASPANGAVNAGAPPVAPTPTPETAPAPAIKP